MKKMMRFCLIVGTLALMSVSCTKICDAPDVDSLNALPFQFKTDGNDGFSESEINSAYMVRYLIALGDSLTFPVDTVSLEGRDNFRLTNYDPFRNDSIGYVRYNYAILFESNDTLSYVITQIELKGQYTGECAYENQLKKFTWNGQVQDITEFSNPFLITK
jgi:hypothetical protein